MTLRRPGRPAPGPLEAYAAEFDDRFASLAQRRRFREYLAGLLLPRERNKTPTALAGAEPVVRAQAAPVQQLRFFLSESTWEAEAVNARRLELACADPASRTKPQLAVEPVDAALGAGVPFRAVVADCFYGENATFEGALRAAALPCVPALKPAGGVWAPAEAAHTPEAAARELTRDGPGAPGDWTPVVRRFRDGHEETRWAAELTFGPYGPDRPRRAVVATTDPATLPELSTWYPVTDLPRPGAPHAAEAPLAPADPAEVVRLYGLRNRVEQGYKQVKRELGWADFMVRSDRAIRRHWHLVCCAFSFRWRAWFAELGSPTAPAEPHAAPAAAAAAGRGGMACLSPARPVAWPMTLRRVRGWLDPGTFLWRCWRAWSNAPPPPELQALLHSVGQGRPLNVETFCLIDDGLKELRSDRPVRSRGPTPLLADSEVLTMEGVGEFLGPDRDLAIYRFFRRHYGAFFPALRRVHRTSFARQASNLWAVKERLWQRLLRQIPHEPGFAPVDSSPVPACQFARAYRCRRFRGEAAYGKDTLIRQTFYGFRFHARRCWPGLISRFVLAPANVSELAALPALAERTSGLLLGDRNYHAPALAAELARDGVELLAPFRWAGRDPTPRRAALIGRFRFRIDTVSGQLVERYHAKKVWARDAWHLWSRLLRKVLSHTLAVLLAVTAGLPPLPLADLVTE